MESLDYTAILADLEAKKAALEAAIASVRAAMGAGLLGQIGEGAAGLSSALAHSMSGGEVPDGAFLGKSIPEGAKLYLEIVKKKQTTREIADALQKGGMESTSKDFPGIVLAVLGRARKAPKSAIVKVGNQWGLATWYPKGVGVVAPNAPKKRGKKKQQKIAKATGQKPGSKAETKPAPAAQPVPITEKKKGAGEQIMEMLQSKPALEFTPQQIAQQVGKPVSITHLMLANLVRARKAEKTPRATYRLAIPKPNGLHATG